MPIINTDVPTLDQTLDHPEMLQAFEVFLDKEFSSENVAFYRAMQDFQEQTRNPNISDNQLRQQAANIYDHYVKAGSTRQVNISSGQLKVVEYQLENLATMNRQQMRDTFTESMEEVKALFRKDTFRRFNLKPEFKEAAQKVEDNAEVEKQIKDLEAKRRQALLNPSVKDRLKSSVGSKTKEQELAQQINALQSELEPSRLLKPLDVPQANMHTVATSISQVAAQNRAAEARKAAEEAAEKQAQALKESQQQQQPQQQDKGESVDKQDLQQLQKYDVEQPTHGQEVPLAPPRVGSPSVSSDPGDLDKPEVPQFEIGDDGWPELQEQDGMELQPQDQSQNQNEFEDMNPEELSQLDIGRGRGRGERVEEVDLGQMRGRSKGMDTIEEDVGQTRGRSRVIPEPPEPHKPSVRDSLGHRDGQPKQGQGGPKVQH